MKLLKRLYRKDPLRFITYVTVISVISILLIMTLIFISYLKESNYDINKLYYDGTRKTIIVTGSMEPIIKVNGIVTIEQVDFDDVELGDIIRFNNTDLGYSVCHRVVGIGQGFLITKGDNNKSIDSFKVTREVFNGRVTDIDNNYADILSLIFGRVDIENWSGSLVRIFLGFVGLAITVGILIIFIYWIFDIQIIKLFALNKQNELQESLEWLDNRTNKNEMNDIINNYRDTRKNVGIVNKIILDILFRTFYDASDTEKKKALKTLRYKKLLLNRLEKQR